MKAIKIAIVMILILNVVYSLYGWLSPEQGRVAQYPGPAQIESRPAQAMEQEAAEGLELKSLTTLVKEIRSGQELERRLNETGGINNMDLNGDREVDYLFVSEYGEPQSKIGYSITAEPVKGEVQEVADVTVERNGDRAEIQVTGNEQIYGASAVFNDWTPVEREVTAAVNEQSSSAPMHSSYFFPHALWISPWFFGFYPAFFSPFPVASSYAYSNRINRYNSASVASGRNSYQASSAKSISNPNKGKTATRGIARSLKNPTSTQKQFQVNRNQNLKSGGFGKASRPAAGTALSKQSSPSSFGTSSKATSSGFGAAKKTSGTTLFGKTSKSYSTGKSSFRSSSFGSRSFSFGK